MDGKEHQIMREDDILGDVVNAKKAAKKKK